MQSGEPESHAAYVQERVLVIMSIQDGAEQLLAALRELGASSCEIAQDGEAAVRLCDALQPQLVLIDAERADSLQLIAAVRPHTQAQLVYVCAADAEPAHELVALCSGGLERPVTQARLRRCLAGLALFCAAQQARSSSFCHELLESVARELRAPLQGVSGFAQYLLDGKAGPLADEQITCLQQVELGTQHVLQLVQNALDLSASEPVAREPQHDSVDTEQALREVVELLQPLAIRRDIALDVHLDERLAHVTSDASKLKQVLFQLIASSLQHEAGSGRLSISLQRLNADSFRMEVKDSGPGLSQAMLAHVNTAPHGDRQAGSGWSATRRIVAALGGNLRAFNDKSSGAVFRVELPVHPAAARPYLRST